MLINKSHNINIVNIKLIVRFPNGDMQSYEYIVDDINSEKFLSNLQKIHNDIYFYYFKKYNFLCQTCKNKNKNEKPICFPKLLYGSFNDSSAFLLYKSFEEIYCISCRNYLSINKII